MAKRDPPPRGGPNYPDDARSMKIMGVVHTRNTRFGLKVRVWPKKRGPKATPAQARARADFTQMVELVKNVPAWDRAAATVVAHNSGWTYRDVLSAAVTGRLWSIPNLQQAAIPFILDALSNIPGAILFRSIDGWIGLAPAANGDVMVLTAGVPGWVDPTTLPSGIRQLTGDVIAGPGSGSQAATLAASGVTAGTYHHATVTVDSKGRLTAAASGAVATVGATGIVKPDGSTITIDVDGTIHGAVSGITQLTGDVTAGPGSGAQATALSATGVAAGAYHHATVTVDAKGRLSSAANGAVATGAAVGLVKPDGTSLSVSGAGELSVISGGGGGVGGLWSGVMSTRPTSGNTGLSTWLNQGTAIVADTAIGIAISDKLATTHGIAGRMITAPATPYVINALVANNRIYSGNGLAGIGWYDGSAKLHAVDMNHGGLEVTRWNSVTSFNGADVAVFGTEFHLTWLQIGNDGTNIQFSYSYDGYNWIQLFKVAKASGFLGATGYVDVLVWIYANGLDVAGSLLSWSVQ